MNKKPLEYNFSDKDLFNDVYLETYNNKTRFLHYFGGAGSGKSVWAFQREVMKTYDKKRSGYATIVCRQKFTTLRKTCYNQIKKIISDWGLSNDFKFYVQPLRIINTKTDVCFEFMGLDNPEDLKSLPNVDRFIIEEATDLKNKDTLDQINLRLRGKDKKDPQVVLLYNPININHWINTEIHDKIKLYPDHRIIKTTYQDNKFLDEESIGVIEGYKITNLNFYRIYGLGEWGMPLEGLIYPEYDFYNEEELNYQPHYKTYFGFDSGYNDATTLVKVIVDETQKKVYVKQMFYQTKLTYNSICQLILNCKDVKYNGGLTNYNWKTQVIYGDAQSKQLIESAKESKINMVPAYKGSGKKNIRITLAKEYKIYIETASKDIIREIGSYVWEKDNQGYSDKPRDGNDHALDAMLYALIRQNKNRKRTVFDYKIVDGKFKLKEDL